MIIYLTSYITNTKINIHMIDITYKTGTYASAMFGSNVSPSVVYSDHTNHKLIYTLQRLK